MKLTRISLITLLLVVLCSAWPAVQADDNEAEVELKVKIVAPPSVITCRAYGVGTKRATLNGYLTSPGTASPVAVCFGWDTESHAEDATAYAHWTSPQAMTHTGRFKACVAGLIPGTTYYFRARAEGDGTIYGEERSFTTNPRRRWWKWIFDKVFYPPHWPFGASW